MAQYTVTAGKSSYYPKDVYGAKLSTTTATFFEDNDFKTLDSGPLSIPGLPFNVLSQSQLVIPPKFFGTHVQNRYNDNLPTSVTADWVRSHDCKSGTSMWKYIEVSDNTWNWTNMDSWVNTHYNAGRELVFTLYGTPTWASLRPTEESSYGPSYLGVAAEPSDFTKWSRFCTNIATRYAGKIKYYEVWNEPNYHNNGTDVPTTKDFYFSGTYATLSKMVRLAAQAVKAVDPTAKIICPPTTVWTATSGDATSLWFSAMMIADDGNSGMMKDWVDIIGVHLYLPSFNKVQDLSGMIDNINGTLDGLAISGKEIWDTESAPNSPNVSLLSDERGAASMNRAILTMIAKGISRSCYYQYDHGTMGYIDRSQISALREQMILELKQGNVKNALRFTDGRVAYWNGSKPVLV